jgi:hypothetical protein
LSAERAHHLRGPLAEPWNTLILPTRFPAADGRFFAAARGALSPEEMLLPGEDLSVMHARSTAAQKNESNAVVPADTCLISEQSAAV